MLRPTDHQRLVPAVGLLLLSSCGHFGIDLLEDGTSLDGSGAASTTSVGGDPAGGDPGADGGASGGIPGGDADGGTSGGDTGSGGSEASGGAPSTGGDGSETSGGAPSTGGAAGSGGEPSGGSGGAACEGTTVPNFSLAGWATEAGGTTGGKGGMTVNVWAGGQLQSEIQSKNPFVPLTLIVMNTISPNNTGGDKIDIADVSDVSIIGQGDQGVFDGIGLRVIRSSNIVIRNLRIHHVDIGEKDAISLAGPADHIWIDHCEFDAEFQGALQTTYDGLIDAKANVSHVTYSWNYIHDSWSPILVGSTEIDTSDRRLTMHHNRIENIDSGAPSFRGGNGHVFNNVFSNVATLGINTRLDACVRIENNVFSNVTNPWVSAYSSTLGAAELICNDLDADSTFDHSAPDVSPPLECTATVPYEYSSVLTATSAVSDLVIEHAGSGKLADPEDY